MSLSSTLRKLPISRLTLPQQHLFLLLGAGFSTIGELEDAISSGELRKDVHCSPIAENVVMAYYKLVDRVTSTQTVIDDEVLVVSALKAGAKLDFYHSDGSDFQPSFGDQEIYLDDPIDCLRLSQRSINALSRNGLETIDLVLLAIIDGSITSTRQFGSKSFHELLLRIQHAPLHSMRRFQYVQNPDSRTAKSSSFSLAQVSHEKGISFHALFLLTQEAIKAQTACGLLHLQCRWHSHTLTEWSKETRGIYSESFSLLQSLCGTPLTLTQELAAFATRIKDPRNLRIFVLRNGRYPQTLQQIGDSLGLTRERVRQIEGRSARILIEHFANSQIPLRFQSVLLKSDDRANELSFDSWLDFLNGCSSLNLESGSEEEKLFTKASENPDEFLLDFFIAIVRLLINNKKTIGLVPETIQVLIALADEGKNNVVLGQKLEYDQLPDGIERDIKKRLRAAGVIDIKEISLAERLDEESMASHLYSLNLVPLGEKWWGAKAVEHRRDIVGVDDVFRRNIEKILYYCGDLSLTSMIEGLEQTLYRKGFPAPSPEILNQTLSMMGYRIVNDLILKPDDLDKPQLGIGDDIILMYLDDEGPVLSRSRLSSVFEEWGCSDATLNVRLQQSGLFTPLENGLYCRRGYQPNPEDIEKALADVIRTPLDPEINRSLNGCICISLNISLPAIRNGVIQTSKSCLPTIEGEWPVTIQDVSRGTLFVTESEIRHVRELFRILDCVVGDRVSFIFDSVNHTVEIAKVEEDD